MARRVANPGRQRVRNVGRPRTRGVRRTGPIFDLKTPRRA